MTPFEPSATPPARGSVPLSTYRLQLQPGFGFAEALAAVPYLARLGVGHLHLSPVLQAVPGSAHGYDVVDHSRVSDDLGGEDGLRKLAASAHNHGMGVIVDIVPNHMAVPAPEWLNRQLWEVLRDGYEAPSARWFDIDREANGGRLLMPVLGGSPEEVAGDLRVRPGEGPDGEDVLRYFDHVFPLRPGTAGLALPDLLDAQPYELAHWREGDRRLNYRRFFTITGLIGLRQEDPAVFEATHEVVLRLVADGVVDGLRVDHPDGLADPRGYLRTLYGRTGGAWIVAEKILTDDERLPADWACAGTTGYDSLRRVDGLFADPDGAAALTAFHHELTGQVDDFGEVCRAAKAEVLASGLAAEVARLGRVLDRAGVLAPDRDEALTALLASVPAYRPYVVPGEVAPADAVDLMARALTHVPGRLAVTARMLADLALGHGSGDAAGEFAVRFAQTAAATAAKGVEDRAFYRWYVLTSRNEVGGEPDLLATSPADFHAFADRLDARSPASMTTLSTHDTKRSEDVRARIAVLSERPHAWAEQVRAWEEEAARWRDGRGGPDPYDTALLWQTLVGAWPISPDRAVAYLRKAMREAARSTSWTDPDAAYEESAEAYVRQILTDRRMWEWINDFARGTDAYARVNSLGAKLVQLTMPGVPDVYQGGEGVLRTLVDPDNRAPVDLTTLDTLLTAADDGVPPRQAAEATGGAASPEAAEKLMVTAQALRTRRAHPLWFSPGAPYTPLGGHGPGAAHVLAFRRSGAITAVTRLPVGLEARGGWDGTTLPLPPGRWRDVLTDRWFSGAVPLTDLHGLLPPALPVALLVAQEGRGTV